MDKKLQLIRHLYGEADDRSELRDLLSDEDLNAEYQELSEAKFWLDHTSHERPDRSVLNAIFEAAAEASPAVEASEQHQTPRLNNVRPAQKRVLDTLRPLPPSHRSDREPIARQQSKRRSLFKPVATVLMLLVTVSVGYQFWQSQGLSIANQELSATSDIDAQSKSLAPSAESRALGLDANEEALVADDALFDREQPNAPRALAGEANGLQLTSSSVADTSLPEWNDDLDKILRYQRRIDMLLEQNQDLAWDEAAVPLEMLPSGRPANPSLLQAGSRQTNSGNR